MVGENAGEVQKRDWTGNRISRAKEGGGLGKIKLRKPTADSQMRREAERMGEKCVGAKKVGEKRHCPRFGSRHH